MYGNNCIKKYKVYQMNSKQYVNAVEPDLQKCTATTTNQLEIFYMNVMEIMLYILSTITMKNRKFGIKNRIHK